MKNSASVIGIALLFAAAGIALLVAVWLAAGMAEQSVRLSGAVLGAAITCIFIIFPLTGAGGFLLFRGRKEAQSQVRVQRQRKMLGIVESAGEISVADLALEIGGTRDSVRDDLYDLVSKGLFSGYVDWNRGWLYARQASEIRSLGNHCPNCGAEQSLAGKGIIRCNFCGSDIFLP